MKLTARISEAYNNGVDRIMRTGGMISVDEAWATFGGVPKYNWVGLTGRNVQSLLNGNDYWMLGPYQGAYKKIVQAHQQGRTEITFTPEDLGIEGCLFRIGELTRLQEESHQRGTPSLVSNVSLNFDFESISNSRPQEQPNQ